MDEPVKSICTNGNSFEKLIETFYLLREEDTLLSNHKKLYQTVVQNYNQTRSQLANLIRQIKDLAQQKFKLVGNTTALFSNTLHTIPILSLSPSVGDSVSTTASTHVIHQRSASSSIQSSSISSKNNSSKGSPTPSKSKQRQPIVKSKSSIFSSGTSLIEPTSLLGVTDTVLMDKSSDLLSNFIPTFSHSLSFGDPFGPSMSKHYERVIDFIRMHPKLLCKSWKMNFIHAQTESMDTVQLLEMESIIVLVVYCLYGNTCNEQEDNLLSQFLQTVIDTIFKYCSVAPMDIINNLFFVNFCKGYLWRSNGMELLKHSLSNCLLDLLLVENFPVTTNSNTTAATTTTANTTPKSNVSSPSYKRKTLLVEAIPVMDFENESKIICDTLLEFLKQLLNALNNSTNATPFSLRFVMYHIVQSAWKRFPNASLESIHSTMKQFIFVFLIPTLLRDADTLYLDSIPPIPSERKSRLQTTAHVLCCIAQRKFFEKDSVWFPLNNFFDFIHANMECYVHNLFMISKCSTEPIPQITKMMDRFFSKLAYSVGLMKPDCSNETVKKLTPIHLATSEVQFLMNSLTSVMLTKSKHFPQTIKDSIAEINAFQESSPLTNNCLYCFGSHEMSASVTKRDSNHEPLFLHLKETKFDKLAILLYRILNQSSRLLCFHVRIEQFSTLSLIEWLEFVARQEQSNTKASNNHILITEIYQAIQLTKELITNSEEEEKLISSIHKEIEWRKHHQNRTLTEQYSTTLCKFISVQQHMEHMMLVKENLQWMDENEKIKIFLETIPWNEQIFEIEKSAFVEEQDAKIYKCYERYITPLHQFLKSTSSSQGVNQAEIERHHLRWKRHLFLRLSSKLMNSNPQYIQKDKEIEEKSRQLFPHLQPSLLEIKPQYYTICTNLNEAIVNEWIKLDKFVLPDDKLGCVARIGAMFFDLMRIVSNSIQPAIDDYLPLLIYYMIVLRPVRLFSNLKFMDRFLNFFTSNTTAAASSGGIQYLKKDNSFYSATTNSDRTNEYWLRHFEAAVLYLESLDIHSLLPTTTNTILLDQKPKRRELPQPPKKPLPEPPIQSIQQQEEVQQISTSNDSFDEHGNYIVSSESDKTDIANISSEYSDGETSELEEEEKKEEQEAVAATAEKMEETLPTTQQG